MMVKARSWRPLEPLPLMLTWPSSCHLSSFSKPPRKQGALYKYIFALKTSRNLWICSQRTQERFQAIQQRPEGGEQDPGSASLLQLILGLFESGPELGHH